MSEDNAPVPADQYDDALRVMARGRVADPEGWNDALEIIRRAIRYGVARVCQG